MNFDCTETVVKIDNNDTRTYGVQMSTSEEVEVKMSFEDLRKRARQLESEIDVKLVSFSKIAASYGSSSAAINTNPESVSLLSGDQM